jgi:hypothetical protein
MTHPTPSLRSRRVLRHAIPWACLAALSLACTVEDGERSESGGCPEGETCSELTSGLRFHGPLPTDGSST